MYYDANLIAIIVASLGALVFGGIWYSPKVFGKAYMQLSGKSEGSQAKKDMKKSMFRGYFIMFLMGLVQAAVLYLLILITQAGTIGQYMTIAFLVWAGFQFSGIVVDNTWEGRSPKLIVLHAFHALFANVVMVYLLTLFL